MKGARIVDFANDFVGDLYIKDGKINEIGIDLNKSCETINAKGYVLMPSFIDLHSHFRDPGLTYKEDIESGSRAAVRGGYTAVNLMGNTKPFCSNMDVVNYVLDKAKKIGLIEVHQAVTITKDLEGKDISHLEGLDKTVKCISDDGKGVESSRVLLEAMKIALKKNFVVMSHAQEKEVTEVSSRLAENLMTERDIELAEFTGCHLHLCHVSTIEAMSDIVRAKKSGYKNITCEVTPHNIYLTGENTYKVNPPLREEKDRLFLIDAIRKGYVDAIGTDHAPHSSEDKKNGASGISGIETAFSVCYTELVRNNKLDIKLLSKVMSKTPAEILRLKKGKICAGYDADLVIVDIDKKYKVDTSKFYSKGKNSCFESMEFYGDVLRTIRKGKTVYKKM
ncbi:MAG: dihydroorotase [Clostridium sp.]|nr:dihydroorotase [Clostridium sp.]